MRHDATDLCPSPGDESAIRQQCRVGRSRVSVLNRRTAGLLLLGVIVMVWLSHRDPLPDVVPIQLARGVPVVETLAFAFSPDGRTIATTHSDGRVALRDVADGWGVRRFLDDRGHDGAVAFSAEGRWLVLGGNEPDIVLCDLARGERARHLGMPIRQTRALALAPDGRTLAASGYLSN